MGRSRKKMKMIHAKRIRKAKEKIRLHRKGEIEFKDLNSLSKRMLNRQKQK